MEDKFLNISELCKMAVMKIETAILRKRQTYKWLSSTRLRPNFWRARIFTNGGATGRGNDEECQSVKNESRGLRNESGALKNESGV